MAKQSGYLQRREAELDATFNAGAAMAMQFAMDTLQMALHQTEGWGYDRRSAGVQTGAGLPEPGGGRPTGAHGQGAGADHQREGGADPL